jgi:tRNA(Ile2) C34 agmatinyltransferase TiaS
MKNNPPPTKKLKTIWVMDTDICDECGDLLDDFGVCPSCGYDGVDWDEEDDYPDFGDNDAE